MSKQYNWYRLTDADDPVVAEQAIAVYEVHGKKICFSRFGGQLYAFAYKCPHAGWLLAEGFIDGQGNVVCPLHLYRFSLRNGYNSSGEGFYLKTYPIEMREDGIFVGMEKSWLSW